MGARARAGVAIVVAGIAVLGPVEATGDGATTILRPVPAAAEPLPAPLAAATTSGTGRSSVLGIGEALATGATAPDAGPAVGLAPTPTGGGYWVATADGGVFSSGDAPFHGSAGALPLNRPIVTIAGTRTGRGYWLAASDGGIFTYGDAPFLGSAGALPLNRPVVGMAPTPTGRGYWLVASDGGIFTYGDAAFLGSTGAMVLNRPIVGMAATPTGRGYWLVASDGGVFTFGDAAFLGAATGADVAAIATTPTGRGYWVAEAGGGVRPFGDAPLLGAAAVPPGQRVVGAAAHPGGGGYWLVATATSRPITVAAAGDVHGEARIRSLLDRGGNPLADIAPVLAAADVAMVNLETAVGSRGQPVAKEYTFQAPPSLPHALKAAGVDAVSLANNHALDYGPEALLETIGHARAAGLVVVGAGADAREAYAPALVGGVAVVGLTRVLPGGWAAGPGRPGVASGHDVGASLAAVRAAAALSEHVVVMVHWGVELARCPDASQRTFADQLVAAGADVVAGHHPHVLQPVERRGPALVAFSLGNFVWYHSRRPSDATGVLTTTLEGGAVTSHRFTPARVGASGGPQPLGGREADEVAALTTAGC